MDNSPVLKEKVNGLEALGMLTFLRSYSKGGKENWGETTERYLQFMRDSYPALVPQINGFGQAIHDKLIVPSMRAMQFAGDVAKRDPIRLYNCSFMGMSDFKDFADLCYLLACGCGVGLSVEQHYISTIPVITTGYSDRFIVGDSKEAWSDSFEALLENPMLAFDYSRIRPAGAPLSSGGAASGSGPLRTAHEKIRAVLLERAGKQLRSVDVADFACFIAEAIISGSVRRSALIVLFSAGDEDMLGFKNGNWWDTNIQRSKANISEVNVKNSSTVYGTLQRAASSPTGEPGIILVDSVNHDENTGTNPCVRGDTTVLTRCGYQAIETLVGVPTEIWNGFEWSEVTPSVTGKNQKMLKVRFSDGRELHCTEYHNFHTFKGNLQRGKVVEVKAKDLREGDRLIKSGFPVLPSGVVPAFNAYAQGFKAADGMDGYDFMWVYPPKFICLERLGHSGAININKTKVNLGHSLPKVYIPFELNQEGRLDWLAGVFDGDGCVIKSGGIQLCSVDFGFLRGLQDLLSTLGVQSKVLDGTEATGKLMPDGRGGKKLYQCQKIKRLCVGATQVLALTNMGLKCERLDLSKITIRDGTRFVYVTSVEDAGVSETVYCFNEPKRHLGVFNGVVTGQCGEISLRSHSTCNLSEVILPNCKSESDLLFACRAASFFGTLQAGFTDFRYIKPVWSERVSEDALLGVSLTGCAQKPKFVTASLLEESVIEIKKQNRATAAKIGINAAARCTAIKPSGSTSCVMGCTSGVHAAHGEYIVRRVRVTKLSPLGLKLVSMFGISPIIPTETEHGTHLLPMDKYSFIVHEAYSDKDIVLQFPCHYQGAIYRKNESSVELLERAAWFRKHWIVPGHVSGQETNNVSLTVSHRPEEKEEIIAWMLNNQDKYRGISVLPDDCTAYPLLPFEEVSKEEFDKYYARFPDLNFEELGISSNVQGTSACSGGAGCEINSL